MSTLCCDPAVPFSLWLSLREGLVSDEICNSPWLVNQLATVERVRTTSRKQCWFCLFWRLNTTFFWMCFGVFRTISHSLQAWYLANWQLFWTTG